MTDKEETGEKAPGIPPTGDVESEQFDLKSKLSMLNDADKIEVIKTGCLNAVIRCLLEDTESKNYGTVFAAEINLVVNKKIKTRLLRLFKPKRAKTPPPSALGKKWQKVRKRVNKTLSSWFETP